MPCSAAQKRYTTNVHSVDDVAKLVIPDVPFPAQLSTLTRGQCQVKPASLLIPIDLLYFSFGGGIFLN
jgi:hypothetical protein